jgi:hypothetical protein
MTDVPRDYPLYPGGLDPNGGPVDLDEPTDRLWQMYRVQQGLQRRFYDGVDPATFNPTDRAAYLQIMAFSAESEIHEAMGEVGWKPWATSSHLRKAEFMAEMVDAWHFFMNMMIGAGMTPDDLYRGYMVKQNINHQRITNGYDGVTNKCPSCKRALDDPATECRIINDQSHWCVNYPSVGIMGTVEPAA